MRKLVFGGEEQDKTNYQTLYAGFLLGTPQEGLRGLGKNRSAMKIMDKFEALARPENSYKEGERRQMLPSGDFIFDLREPGEITLDQAEYEMLKTHVENTPWVPGSSRRAVAALEFLENAPEE